MHETLFYSEIDVTMTRVVTERKGELKACNLAFQVVTAFSFSHTSGQFSSAKKMFRFAISILAKIVARKVVKPLIA